MLLAIHIFLVIVGLAAFFISIFSFFRRLTLYSKFVEEKKTTYDYTPPASVIMPVRGIDEKLHDLIESALNQDYPKYEVLIVVDADDKSTENEVRRMVCNDKRIRIVSSAPLLSCSGKCSATIAGVKSSKYGVLAFLDSDVIVGPDWLRNIVGPLSDKSVGATTGFRYYIQDNFFSSMLSAWNNIGLAQMSGSMTFVWGGSFAIKKQALKKLGVMEKWARSISEDSVVTHAVRNAGMIIKFVPQCIVKSYPSAKYSHPLEFTTRQLTLVRWYWPKTYKAALALYSFGRLTTIVGIALLAAYTLTGSVLLLLESLLLLWATFFGALRASVEAKYLEILTATKIPRLRYAAADFAAQWLMTYNLLRAASKRSITWRGRAYRKQ